MTDEQAFALQAEVAALVFEVRALREVLQGRTVEFVKAAKPEPAYSPAFLSFWDAYACPRRRNKPAAWREWRRLKLGNLAGEMSVVLTALDAYKLTSQWRDGFMPEPARWLKSEPWLDEPSQPAAPAEDDWSPRR